MVKIKGFLIMCLISAFVIALLGGAACAQQAADVDIRQLVPPDSLLVVAIDARPSNPSIQVIQNAETPEMRDQWAKQKEDLHKAIENFAVLFGISLDWARDIQSWNDQQIALVLLPDGPGNAQAVVMIASKDAAAANAFLQKALAPLQRTGELTPQPDADYPITAFKMKHEGGEAYFSAYGPVVAFASSKTALKQALKGGGFAAGSPGDRVFKTLSGSVIYAYASPAMLDLCGVESKNIPVESFGLGVSAIETGLKLRVLGYPNPETAKVFQQMLALQQTGAVSVNPGIPSPSIAAASFTNLSGLMGFAGLAGPKSPMVGLASALGDTQISAAITAVLPTPTGVATAMAASEQAAADKYASIVASLQQIKMQMKPVTPAPGIQANALYLGNDKTVYMAQIGQYIVVSMDAQTLADTAATIKGGQPGVAQSAAYQETIAGLGNSNLLTLYVNLAPVQGVGYLINGTGLGQMAPMYEAAAKGLENMQALGLGLGFDGEVADVTLFLRAKPGFNPAMAPVATLGAIFSAGVMSQVLERTHQVARHTTCESQMKELALAAQAYAMDNNGKLPASANWRAELDPYLKSDIKCPSGNTIYAFNKNLSGLKLSNIADQAGVVMFFEANPGLPNATGSRANAVLAHNGIGCFAYVDGHVMMSSVMPSQSHWVPKYTQPKPAKKAPVKKTGTRKAK